MSAELWLQVLRDACTSSTQGAVAQKIGYSAAVVSTVLSGTYRGDLQRVQLAVEGALMAATVDCPVVGDMPQQRCIEHQRTPFRSTNHMVVQIYHACRGGCPHSLVKPDPAAKETP